MYKEIDFEQSLLEKKNALVYILFSLLSIWVILETIVLVVYGMVDPSELFRVAVYAVSHIFMVILSILMIWGTKKTKIWQKAMMIYLLVEAALVIILIRESYLFYLPTFCVELGLLLLMKMNFTKNKTLNATAIIILSFLILGGSRLGYIFAEISNDVLIIQADSISWVYLWTIFQVGYMVFPVLIHYLIYSATPLSEEFKNSLEEPISQ